MIDRRRTLAGLSALLAAAGISPKSSAKGADEAWRAWSDGDLAQARAAAEGQDGDSSLHVLALAAHITGEHDAAISAYGNIDPAYPRIAELDLPILWSYLHKGDIAGGAAFIERRVSDPEDLVRKSVALSAERPPEVEIAGLVELPYTDDALTPYMPGLAARVNGAPMTARIDTGGAFLYLSGAQADALGVARVAHSEGFASLRRTRIGAGVANLELGPVSIRNVPVAVFEDGLQSDEVAAAFGVAPGAIIGTNVLEPFLATLDAAGGRLLLSPRRDAAAEAKHLALLPEARTEIPFALWTDHYMFARGRIGTARSANLFIDSGLVALDDSGRQASLLASKPLLRDWDARSAGALWTVPDGASLGPLAQQEALALPVPRRTWRQLEEELGCRFRVDALLSYGFLKRYAWTLDFDRHVYVLSA